MGVGRGAWALGVIGALVLACGSEPGPTGSDAGPPPDVDAALPPITLFGELDRYDTRDRLPDTQVCVVGEPTIPCVRTDEIGGFSIVGVARNTELVLEVARDDASLVPTRILLRTGTLSDFVGNWAIVDRATLDAALATSGVSWDETTTGIAMLMFRSGGFLLPYSWSPDGLPSATVGAPATDRVVYVAGDGSFDPTLTSTSSFGAATIFRTSTDDAEMTIAHPGADCVLDQAQGWPGASADVLRVRAAPGTLTHAALVHCVRH